MVSPTRANHRSAASPLSANMLPANLVSRFNVTFWSIGSFALTFPQAENRVEKIGISGLSHWTSTLIPELDRRQFLSRTLAAAGATWTVAHWPAVLAAA
ncbi:MAG TPA: hypothetical protein VFR42_13010, partial [Candidatus Acidoferrum sp.]|nr:hypothetical protein [Candidatus Acidoferrum sp.]